MALIFIKLSSMIHCQSYLLQVVCTKPFQDQTSQFDEAFSREY